MYMGIEYTKIETAEQLLPGSDPCDLDIFLLGLDTAGLPYDVYDRSLDIPPNSSERIRGGPFNCDIVVTPRGCRSSYYFNEGCLQGRASSGWR